MGGRERERDMYTRSSHHAYLLTMQSNIGPRSGNPSGGRKAVVKGIIFDKSNVMFTQNIHDIIAKPRAVAEFKGNSTF